MSQVRKILDIEIHKNVAINYFNTVHRKKRHVNIESPHESLEPGEE